MADDQMIEEDFLVDPSLVIYKYPLRVTDVQTIRLPRGASLLHVAMQNGTLTLWAHGDYAAPQVERLIAVVGTGNPAPSPDDCEYVGTVFDGPFVWHVFAKNEGAE